jgi:uncharacterized membrane protein HdeD (DUF308 family)
MLDMLARKWWLYVARGVLAIVFGLLALILPEQTKLALVLVFGVYALGDGIFSVFTGIAIHRYFRRWWAVLLEGIAGILVGLVAFLRPDVTGLALLYFIAAWALVTGIFEIVAAIQLRRLIVGEWAMILSGLLSIALGVVLFVFPGAGAVSLVWMIGIYAILFGTALIFLAIRLRGLWHELESASVTGI